MVYVDYLFTMESKNPQAKFVGTRTNHQWCHMWADTLEELHAMAEKLGLKRAWFQNRESLPHYDLVPSKRKKAIQLGAKEISIYEYLREKKSDSI